jgi:hypothetical protein
LHSQNLQGINFLGKIAFPQHNHVWKGQGMLAVRSMGALDLLIPELESKRWGVVLTETRVIKMSLLHETSHPFAF